MGQGRSIYRDYSYSATWLFQPLKSSLLQVCSLHLSRYFSKTLDNNGPIRVFAEEDIFEHDPHTLHIQGWA